MNRILLFFILFISFTSLTGQRLSQETIKSLDALTTQYISEGAPGVAIGVVQDGQIIYEQYAGLADLERQRKIDEQTMFNIASNGKQFTALSILKLLEMGQLNLEDDVREYLPKLLPSIATPITIKHLLNHTSGVRDIYNLWSLQGYTWWEESFSNEDVIQLLYQQNDLNFQSGSKYMYSNSNYILLTEIVKVVSGQSFKTFSDQLFQELGMKNTYFLADHQQVVPFIARPYFNFDTWLTYDWLTDVHGDGALFTTLQDQLRWELIVQSLSCNSLTEASLKMSQSPLPGTKFPSYGFGLEFDTYKGLPYTYHDGSTGAWKGSFVRFPEHNLAIVAMNNTGAFGTNELVRSFAEVIIGEAAFTAEDFPTVPPPSSQAAFPISEILGTYRTESGYFCKIVEQDGRLYMQRFGRDAIELEMERDNVFREVTDKAFKQAFVKDPSLGYQLTFYYPSVPPFTFNKVKSLTQDGYDFKALNGKYLNRETNAEVSIKWSKEDQYNIKSGKEKLDGQLFMDNTLIIDGYRAELVRSETGQVIELLLFDGRLQNVKFERIGR